MKPLRKYSDSVKPKRSQLQSLHSPQTICPICESEQDPSVLGKATLGGGSQFDLVECRNCKTRYLHPLPTVDQLERLYWPHYYGSDWYKQLGWGKAFGRLVLGKRPPGKFLDVGCGLGFFIDGVRKTSNWEVHGVEITSGPTEFARDRLGLDVRRGELVDIQYPDAFFDYIRLCNVLEHVTDPVTLLKECRRILKPDGLVLLRVPNGPVDSRDLVKFYRNKHTAPFSKSGHVFFFTRDTLLRMFETAGLTVVRSRTYGIRRGLARLGFWPRLKDWKRHYVSEPRREPDDSSRINLAPGKRRPDFYYLYRMTQMALRMLPGMRNFGLDYELLLQARQPSDESATPASSLIRKSKHCIATVDHGFQRIRYSLRQQGFSQLNEEQILGKYIDQMLPPGSPKTVVDIGAGNGIRRSNTYSLFLKGWKGVGIEADARKFALLKRAYRNLPNAVACNARVNRENIVPLLESLDVEKDFSVLSLDIDGNDYWILNAILSEFRPSLIVTEINEKIPPPIRFVVKYDPNFHLRHHFYGYSISALMDLCKRYDYGLLELEYNNAFIAPAELAGDRFVDPQTEYAKGYRDRPDRKRQFPLNFEMEDLLTMSPEEGLEFIEQFYKNEAGNYYASMSPIEEPA